jgi:hypothetical protein
LPFPDNFERRIRLIVVDRDTHAANLARALQLFQGPAPLVASDPLRIPDVQLLQIDGLEAQVLETLLGREQDVLIGEDLLDADTRLRGPQVVLRRDLGGDVDAAAGIANYLPHQLLAVPLTIRHAVSMKFKPNSMARRRAARDFRSSAPSHWCPPIPRLRIPFR